MITIMNNVMKELSMIISQEEKSLWNQCHLKQEDIEKNLELQREQNYKEMIFYVEEKIELIKYLLKENFFFYIIIGYSNSISFFKYYQYLNTWHIYNQLFHHSLYQYNL